MKRLIKINWSGWWTRPWPGYFMWAFNEAVKEYKKQVTKELYEANPLFKKVTK